ncbi:iron-sulfur cluster repair di-iron protein [Rudanella paleaurantiibacter]|uniref:Iron-sulfur cluster repair di-iron protein n=1 Tax=Rudanella paleaurantiibacter TaxID=2614655 RepID=A0A7J5TTN7_9BACT|nr:iron-sulfur cluster repair di-iron protein [Rudanella paleaurantiibacter]KAB7726825.1 iron-sulfur cluster repair di-iron protein [Rudanella paleaurantiibacter]
METISAFNASTVTVGQLVADDIRAAEVFKRLGIDFCCNGKRTLADACARAEVSVDTVLDKLSQLPTGNRLGSERFDEWELGFLADYILNVHHAYLYQNLPFIEELVVKVANKHGVYNPTLLVVRQVFTELKDDLLSHLKKEEIALFPFIRKLINGQTDPSAAFGGQAVSLKAPIDCMEHEHSYAGSLLAQLREITNDYTPPTDACNSHRLMLAKMEELENDLMRHIHLENNILFPKALALEGNYSRVVE